MKFLNELFSRWDSESPRFFKTLGNFGKWLTVTGLALVGIPAAIDVVVPSAGLDLSTLVKIASYIVLAGMVISAVAGLPVKDTKQIEK